MSDTTAKLRSQFRNIGITQIASYRLPLAGKLSILHRVSGALLFFCLPLLVLPLFEASVSSAQSYASIATYTSNSLVKVVFLVLIWGYLHHFCAGIRYLLLDLHIGIDKLSSRKSAGLVFGVSLSLTLMFGLKLLGAL